MSEDPPGLWEHRVLGDLLAILDRRGAPELADLLVDQARPGQRDRLAYLGISVYVAARERRSRVRRVSRVRPDPGVL